MGTLQTLHAEYVEGESAGRFYLVVQDGDYVRLEDRAGYDPESVLSEIVLTADGARELAIKLLKVADRIYGGSAVVVETAPRSRHFRMI